MYVRWRRHCSHNLDWRKAVGTGKEKCEILAKFSLTYCQVSYFSTDESTVQYYVVTFTVNYSHSLLAEVTSCRILNAYDYLIVLAVPLDVCVLLFVFVFLPFCLCSSFVARQCPNGTIKNYVFQHQHYVFMSLCNIINRCVFLCIMA